MFDRHLFSPAIEDHEDLPAVMLPHPDLRAVVSAPYRRAVDDRQALELPLLEPNAACPKMLMQGKYLREAR